MLSFEIRSEIKFLIDLIFFLLNAWQAFEREGEENLGERPRSRNSLPVPFQTPATQATGGPEKVLGLTCVQSQISREIRKAQPVISEFSTFLKINKSREHFFKVNSFYPIYD